MELFDLKKVQCSQTLLDYIEQDSCVVCVHSIVTRICGEDVRVCNCLVSGTFPVSDNGICQQFTGRL